MQAEHIIRDWLVANPEFIEPGLQIVKKEYYLPDEIGTSGFIDILAKDIYNNFVIVEIKRSDPAARQTLKSLNLTDYGIEHPDLMQ
jgi:RecB family endonuclease NucS